MKVAIIDYEMSNLYSVKNACDYVGLDCQITSDKNVLLNSDAAILPGVGAFREAMNNLEKLDLIYPIKDFISQGKQFLGVCLGLQLLLSESEEFGDNRGLGLIEGNVLKLPEIIESKHLIIPQMGWNTICKSDKSSLNWDNSLLHGIKNGEFMYFVHSYYVKPVSDEVILSLTNYEGFEFCSGIKKENITAFQFHPEKSGEKGIEIYKNFKKLVENQVY